MARQDKQRRPHGGGGAAAAAKSRAHKSDASPRQADGIRRPLYGGLTQAADLSTPSSLAAAAASEDRTLANLYAGCRSSDFPSTVRRLSTQPAPLQFWNKYVCKRKPVVIAAHPTDPSWTASSKWTNEYLIKTAGDEPIRVEVRSSEQGVFGRGNKKDTTFGKLVAAMASGDTSLYLTTQDVAAAADGFPELHAGPVSRLSTDFPARPALLGGLVPQNINLWMGCAPDGASSGLHHDFHDNLYVLLRGRKRFRLYSPELVSRMYTHGTPRTVHPNGRIVYAGDGDVRADGVSTGPAAAVPHLHPFTLTALHHTHHD